MLETRPQKRNFMSSYLKESGDFFYYGNDEFLIYCYVYQFIPCKMAGWGKQSEKTFKEQQNNYTFRILSS